MQPRAVQGGYAAAGRDPLQFVVGMLVFSTLRIGFRYKYSFQPQIAKLIKFVSAKFGWENFNRYLCKK